MAATPGAARKTSACASSPRPHTARDAAYQAEPAPGAGRQVDDASKTEIETAIRTSRVADLRGPANQRRTEAQTESTRSRGPGTRAPGQQQAASRTVPDGDATPTAAPPNPRRRSRRRVVDASPMKDETASRAATSAEDAARRPGADTSRRESPPRSSRCPPMRVGGGGCPRPRTERAASGPGAAQRPQADSRETSRQRAASEAARRPVRGSQDRQGKLLPRSTHRARPRSDEDTAVRVREGTANPGRLAGAGGVGSRLLPQASHSTSSTGHCLAAGRRAESGTVTEVTSRATASTARCCVRPGSSAA